MTLPDGCGPRRIAQVSGAGRSTTSHLFAARTTGLIGKLATFWIYAFIGILASVFIWLRVPETKGRSLERIEEEVHGQPEQAA